MDNCVRDCGTCSQETVQSISGTTMSKIPPKLSQKKIGQKENYIFTKLARIQEVYEPPAVEV